MLLEGLRNEMGVGRRALNLLLGRRKQQTTIKEMMMHAWHDHTAGCITIGEGYFTSEGRFIILLEALLVYYIYHPPIIK